MEEKKLPVGEGISYFKIWACASCENQLSWEDYNDNGGVCPHCGAINEGYSWVRMIFILVRKTVTWKWGFIRKVRYERLNEISTDGRKSRHDF
jgi:NAD-dependent SIR2 family protein deacetylase